MPRKNLLKAKLTAGQSTLGTWCEISSATVANVLANAGLDFVIIDMEHGAMSYETAENMCRAVEAEGSTPIIRVTETSDATILRALELGGQSILVPHVESVATAHAVVNACRYSPLGNRGMGPYTRNHNYSHQDLTASLARTNEETLVGILVEGKEGLAALPEIADVPGLDLIYLGVYDISSSVGHPGELRHPTVIAAVEKAAATLKAKGIASGSFAPDIEYAKLLARCGMQFIAYYNDVGVLRQHFHSVRSAWE